MSPVAKHSAAFRFGSVANTYEQYRPEPPAEIFDCILGLARVETAACVIDLGCGTGVSTRPWASRAERVIGVDPSERMLDEARRATSADNIHYCAGTGEQVPVAEGLADVVACSSSIHWFDPVAGFGEIRRLLRPAGVFAAFGPQVPALPWVSWEVAAEVTAFLARARELDRSDTVAPPEIRRWPDVLAYCRHEAGFRYADELSFHSIVRWSAESYCRWLETFSYVATLLAAGHPELTARHEALRALCLAHIGVKPVPVQLSYRLMLGIR